MNTIKLNRVEKAQIVNALATHAYKFYNSPERKHSYYISKLLDRIKKHDIFLSEGSEVKIT